MRISDDRYTRERARLELALRFLQHEARTQTIRTWTGLSDDRIRKLFRSYSALSLRPLLRHRGKSPHQAAFFARSQRLRQETAALASLLTLLGVLPTPPPAMPPAPSVARGELLCMAFELYRCTVRAPQISFEHAVFLLSALLQGDQLRLGSCCGCGGLLVTERWPVRDARCPSCAGSEVTRPTRPDWGAPAAAVPAHGSPPAGATERT